MIVTSYHDLETSTFIRIRAMTLTRIHGKPSWHQLKKMILECKTTALDCTVEYGWSGQFGLLAEIQEPERYLETTGFQYVAPIEPPNRHPEILPATTAHRSALLTAENDLLKHDCAIFKGFRHALSLNI